MPGVLKIIPNGTSKSELDSGMGMQTGGNDVVGDKILWGLVWIMPDNTNSSISLTLHIKGP